ncbi:hypothetical protein RJ639_047159 [Escallonia herrerae]|uniref:N-acetyltransferase domain-containing protein n=1 Tax=Escallonia herrerae TaxID=1293975 RepID=A0AA88W887_9ASTE|nr:hypothetical protein RJ639_047159 [Escallonia herrerae]
MEVVVRVYRGGEEEKAAIEELERQCEYSGQKQGKPLLVTDLMGDPICRVRNFKSHVMLVAEFGEEKEIVGVIRGCIKTVTRGKRTSSAYPVYVRLAYILGLRVCPTHRRLGVGMKLVQHLEKWGIQNGAEYAYMATDYRNTPSVNLFTLKCNYVKFRTPGILVQPVHAHDKPIGSRIAIVRVPPQVAASIYRRVFANSEFFPQDLGLILNNKLSLGTFMALPKKSIPSWDMKSGTLPPSFAILSVWNTKEVFRLQVKGVSPLTYASCVGSRVLDSLMPWLRLPSIPNVFKQFGVHFLYGLHMEGKGAARLMKSLCRFAHNMARDDAGCEAVVAEVGKRDPVREAIPHWRKFSWPEDLWCIKKLDTAKRNDKANESCRPYDWIKSRFSSSIIFVDPRDF